MQEPYVGAEGVLKQYPGTRVVQISRGRQGPVKAAIIVFDDKLQLYEDPNLTTENIAVLILKTQNLALVLVSVYFEEDQPLTPYLNHVQKIYDKYASKYFLIGGDVNAWSTWWGSSKENLRGTELSVFLEELDLQILNEGDEPTFETIRGDKEYRSRVDVTACNLKMLHSVDNWQVDKSVSSSDHNAITFDIRLEKIEQVEKKTTRIYNTKKAKWPEFKIELETELIQERITKEVIEQINNILELEEIVKRYSNSIKQACDKTIPKKKHKIEKTKLPWWTDHLENLKKEMITKKRRIRNAADSRKNFVINQYIQSKLAYETAAAEAQTSGWKDFCNKQDRESMWDGIYRVINRTRKRHNDEMLTINGDPLSPTESVELLARTFYPDDKEEEDTLEQKRIREKVEDHNLERAEELATEDPPFTETEMELSVKSFNPKKAPGPDGFTADICAAAINASPGVFLAIANTCLRLGCFPTIWKIASVVVLRKPGKSDYTNAKSYRPIGLLSIMGKTLEKMLITRLKWHLLPKGNKRQYGFVPQRSTEDSLYDLVNHIKKKIANKEIVTLVSLDIEGAFDSAWWPAIKLQLIAKRCPKNLIMTTYSYLRDRMVRVSYAGADFEKTTNKGCVQGSIGGPTFWNLLLDPLLDYLEATGTYVQAFADDVVLIFSGRSSESIQTEGNKVLDKVYKWGLENKLKFAAHKTNMMTLTNKLKYDEPKLRMGGEYITLVKETKILGLIIDNKLTFNNHVTHICKKSSNIYKQLARAAKISWGLNSEIIRTIYVAVIEPIIMYASSVWAAATTKIKIQKQLNTIQRGFARKICRAYRTVSLNAALLLTGLLPLDTRIREAAALYRAKQGQSIDGLPSDREVEKPVCHLKAPHPSEQIAITYQCINTEEDLNLQAGALNIYTDGSKLQGKVGAAVSCWEAGMEKKTAKLRLEEYCTVFQAELLALSKAMTIVETSKQLNVNILSDSRSALDLVRNPKAFHPLAYSIKQSAIKIKKNGTNLTLYWVKAHAGIPGNERADQLAKEAALYDKKRADYDCVPVSYAKRLIRLESQKEWQHRYTTGGTGETTKLFLPDIIVANKLMKKIKLNPILVQILTGHGGFSSYLYKYKCKSSAACICDPNKEESIVHLIVECPKYIKLRTELESNHSLDIKPDTMKEWISNKKLRQDFIKFCIHVADDAVQRNKTR